MSRSAPTPLTVIEQDAARYRMLQRFLLGCGSIITLDDATQDGRRTTIVGARAFSDFCDRAITDDDVAGVIGQPVSLHVRAEIEGERLAARRLVGLLIKAAGGEISVPLSLVSDTPNDVALCAQTDHASNCVVYSIMEKPR